MKRISLIKVVITAAALILLLVFSNAIAKSGCCSWHHGAAYCDRGTGRVICNDGTYSPSCMCAQEKKFHNRNEHKKLGY